MEPQIHGLCILLIISTPYRTIIALLLQYYCSIIVLLLQNLCTIQPPDTGLCRLASLIDGTLLPTINNPAGGDNHSAATITKADKFPCLPSHYNYSIIHYLFFKAFTLKNMSCSLSSPFPFRHHPAVRTGTG